MRTSLLAVMLALFGCGAVADPPGETTEALTGCLVMPWGDDAYPFGSGTRVEWRLMNIGTAGCWFYSEADIWKNGVKVSGAKQGAFWLDVADDTTTPNPDLWLREDFTQAAPCTYSVWVREVGGSWVEYGPTGC